MRTIASRSKIILNLRRRLAIDTRNEGSTRILLFIIIFNVHTQLHRLSYNQVRLVNMSLTQIVKGYQYLYITKFVDDSRSLVDPVCPRRSCEGRINICYINTTAGVSRAVAGSRSSSPALLLLTWKSLFRRFTVVSISSRKYPFRRERSRSESSRGVPRKRRTTKPTTSIRQRRRSLREPSNGKQEIFS